MNKFLKAIVSLAFLSVSALAAAQQCIPAPQIMGQQQRCYDGRLIGPGGVVYGQQQVVHGQQQVVQQAIYGSVPAGIPIGSSSQCAGIAERLGRVVGANHSNNSRGTENGGLLGYLVGNIFCSSIVGNQQVIANQQPVQVVNQPRCQDGTSWRTLNWEGHPNHGQFKCLPPEEVIAQQKASMGASASQSPCSNFPGTSWRQLDWQGHPNHGQFKCLPSQEVIEQQKAAHAAANG